MTDTYRLHFAPDNASIIIRMVLEELRLPYETALVDRRADAHNKPAYLAINPAGKIPALETADGVIFETAAILLWLADRHEALAPSPMAQDRAAFLKWLFYLSNTLHANFRMIFYPRQYMPDAPESFPALVSGARQNVQQGLQLLEREAQAGHNWFNATTPTVADFYMAAIVRWLALYPNGQTNWFDLTHYPGLRQLVSRLETRPSVQAMCRAEGMTSTPFTVPKLPTPLEGSVL